MNYEITSFTISNRNYGFLWNNPAIGYATFAENVTEWYADSARNVDYWVTAGNSPKEIENNYAMLVGTSPEMPTFGLGFWQCKLRYQTQDELMAVAREYHKRNIPVSVIVADFFHWPNQGDWKFDSTYWPDPKKMVEELKNMGMELMVSVWPTVEKSSENYEEMKDEGYLIQTDHGVANHILSDSAIMDATNPACRKYVWNKIRNNYYKDGIHIFWLDEAEPELTGYEFDHYRFFAGSDKEIGNIYPKEYARMAFEGMQEEGMDKILNLIRCAWIGSQKYGALVWSGDIDSSFSSLRNQIVAGQNMGIAGISWWTTDIGGFCGADISDPKFKELLIRWFQFGTFCPVMRLHGYRKPFKKPIGTTGGGKNGSGADNEIWSFGTDVYDICKYYISLRESMKVYTAKIMHEAHETGTPVMRPLFYEFPSDLKCWDIKYSYMYGSDILVAPITEEKVRATKVYLPEGEEWIDFWSGEQICGGQVVNVEAPLEIIPLFIRASSKTLFQELKQ